MRAGDIVRTRGNSYRLLDGMSEGGYGLVVPAVRSRDGIRVAIKFRAELSDAELTDPLAEELGENVAQRFADEVSLMKALPRRPYFPKYYEKGCHKGRPFFVMEWLNPMTGDDWPPKDDKDRMRFVSDLCEAVQDLHEMGYVHYDIKPSNIMHREGDHWILVDFGSAHVKEEETRIENPLTRSMLSDGRRAFPSTPGYADPVWKLHSVSFDIYSIGQVIRDMFGEDVPLVWSKIINKCISRNPALRYQQVSDIETDVLNLERIGRQDSARLLHELRMQAVRRQGEMVDEKPVKVTAAEFKKRLKVQAGLEPAFVVGKYEMLIDLTLLPDLSLLPMGHSSLEIDGPLWIKDEKLIVIRGPGVLRADFEFCPNGESRTVVLVDNATLINRSRQSPEEAELTYCIGESCYVNLSGLRRTAPLKGWTHKTSLAGFSFIKCNGPEKVSDIIKDMDENLYGDMLYTPGEMYGEGPYADKPGLGAYLHESGLFNSAMGIMSERWCAELDKRSKNSK